MLFVGSIVGVYSHTHTHTHTRLLRTNKNNDTKRGRCGCLVVGLSSALMDTADVFDCREQTRKV